MLGRQGDTKPARYRVDDIEVFQARRALGILGNIEDLAAIVPYADPLRDALQVAARAIALAVRASPILEVSAWPTWVEQQSLWDGPEALRSAEAHTPSIRARLDELVTCAFGFPSGATGERRELVSYIVGAGRLLVADLSRDPKYANDLKAVAELTDVTEAAQGLAFVAAISSQVQLTYHLRYRKTLDFQLVVTALIASAQDALRGGRAGNLPKGAPNHLRAMSELLVSAGIEKPTTQALRDDYRAARKQCGPLETNA